MWMVRQGVRLFTPETDDAVWQWTMAHRDAAPGMFGQMWFWPR